jgi:hypothetical protein
LRSRHFQNGGQCRSRHLLLHINSNTCCSHALSTRPYYTLWGYSTTLQIR